MNRNSFITPMYIMLPPNLVTEVKPFKLSSLCAMHRSLHHKVKIFVWLKIASSFSFMSVLIFFQISDIWGLHDTCVLICMGSKGRLHATCICALCGHVLLWVVPGDWILLKNVLSVFNWYQNNISFFYAWMYNINVHWIGIPCSGWSWPILKVIGETIVWLFW